MLHTIVAVLFIKVNDGLGVAVGAVLMPLRLQAETQFRVVIDFAVKDNPDIPIFVGHRLLARFDIDDAQPPHRKSDVLFHEKPLIIGAAMHDVAIHASQNVGLDAPVAVYKEDSADSTHIPVPILSGCLDCYRTGVYRPCFAVKSYRFRISGDDFGRLTADDLTAQHRLFHGDDLASLPLHESSVAGNQDVLSTISNATGIKELRVAFPGVQFPRLPAAEKDAMFSLGAAIAVSNDRR